MPSCVVRGCASSWKKRDPSVSLHIFPKEPEKIKLWLEQTGQYGADIDKMVVKVYLGKVYDTYRMCSSHFTHDCYNYDGYRRILKKDAIPTVFKKKPPATVPSLSPDIPSVSRPLISSSEQRISSAGPADSQKQSSSGKGRMYRVEFPVVHPKTSSQPTMQQMTLVPVVPQQVFFQPCAKGQKPSPVIVERTVTIQPTANIIREASQMQSALSAASQQSSVLRPSNSSILEVPLSSSCIQQNAPAVLEYTASTHGGQLEQLSPASVQPSHSVPIPFFQKPSSLVLTNSSLPLNTKLRPDATSSSTSSCPRISFSAASGPTISTSGFDKAPYKTLKDPSIISETKPCSTTVLPVSGTQTTSTTSALTQKPIPVVHIPPPSQSIIPDSLSPSKKRKLEENAVFLKPSAPSSSKQSILPNPCISQTSVNTGKVFFVSSSGSVVQPSFLIPKPLMVDKGVNTDFVTNRKSCCIATDPMHRKRNAHTQTKIYTKHRQTMCTLIVPSKPANVFDSSLAVDNPEAVEFSDCSPSSSSDDGNDPCNLEMLNFDVVKVEILDSEEDLPVPTTSDTKQSIHIKEENEYSSEQVALSSTQFKDTRTTLDFDIRSIKIEPNIKTEENPFPISSSSQSLTHFELQNHKIERLSPIPNDPIDPLHTNQTSYKTCTIQTDEEAEYPNDSSFFINELSEDEDESFLVPSDAEDEDDVKPVFQDLDSPVQNHVEEEKYIVFESCLRKLIMMIPCMSETQCMSPLTQYRKETIGSYLSVAVRCRSGHTRLLWESQPRHGYEPLGNVLISAAVLLSGSSFLKTQHMFKLLNLKSIDKTTYSRNQSMYLFPAINHHWKEEQKAVIDSVQERPLCLAGDQQLDNPEFSAKYSIYSLMDVATKQICSFSVEPVTQQVTLEDLEKIGFQKAMGELQTMNADVKMIVTDRSVAIKEFLQDTYPGIVHLLDVWHLSKSIGNEVLMAAKNKNCEILYQWVEAIRNHIWWSSSTCCRNPDLLIQKWKSVIHHVANVHEWDSDSDCKACHHPPLPQEVVKNTNWLEKGSDAHEQLKNIVENTSLLNDLKQVSFLCHTGELEIYHRTCLKYRPKTLHFFMDSMVARTQLAALDHNRNVHRVKAVVKNASSGRTQRVEVSKGQKSWIMKALYEPTCQNLVFNIMNDVLALVREEETFK